MTGKKIRELRKANNLTMNELAKKSGTASSYISDLENGKIKNPSITKMEKIAEALGVSLDELRGKETYDKKVSRDIYNNMSEKDLINLLGLNEEGFKSLSEDRRNDFFEDLSNIEPYKMELQKLLDNFDNITKNDLVNICNSIKEHYIKIIDKHIEEEYKPLVGRYNQLLEFVKFQNEQIEKYQKACTDMLSTLKNSNQ